MLDQLHDSCVTAVKLSKGTLKNKNTKQGTILGEGEQQVCLLSLTTLSHAQATVWVAIAQPGAVSYRRQLVLHFSLRGSVHPWCILHRPLHPRWIWLSPTGSTLHLLFAKHHQRAQHCTGKKVLTWKTLHLATRICWQSPWLYLYKLSFCFKYAWFQRGVTAFIAESPRKTHSLSLFRCSKETIK